MNVTRINPFNNLGLEQTYVQAFQYLVDIGVHNDLDRYLPSPQADQTLILYVNQNLYFRAIVSIWINHPQFREFATQRYNA